MKVRKTQIEQWNADLKQQRQMAYHDTTDSLLMAYHHYMIIGDEEKAATIKEEWLKKVEAIKQRYQYYEVDEESPVENGTTTGE